MLPFDVSSAHLEADVFKDEESVFKVQLVPYRAQRR